MSGVFWKTSLREDLGIDLSELHRLPGMHSSPVRSGIELGATKAPVDTHTYIGWFKVFVITIIATIGIAMASLAWNSSITHADKGSDYQFKDNNLAAQRVGLNSSLIVGFAILGLIGFAGLAYGESSQMSLFKFWVLFPVLFWIWCGASVLWSVEMGLSARRIVHLYMSVMGAFGIAAFLKRQELIWMAILSMFLLSAFGFIAELSLGTFNPWRSGYRFCGLGHPNETGMFGAVMCLAARVSTMMDHADNESNRLFSLRNISWGFLAFGLFVVLLTKSRTTLLSLIVAMFVIQIVMLKAQNAWMFVAATAAAISIMGFCIGLLRSETYNALFGVASIGRSDEVASLTGRLPLWEEILRWVDQKTIHRLRVRSLLDNKARRGFCSDVLLGTTERTLSLHRCISRNGGDWINHSYCGLDR